MEKFGSLLTALLLCMGCAHPSPKTTDKATVQPPQKTASKRPGTEAAAPGGSSVVIFNPKTQEWSFTHRDRARKDRLPDSTFQIMLTLVALQAGVTSPDEVFKWDGTKHRPVHWNKDQTLESAFRHSTTWVFQILARRIGRERMKNYVDLCEYGNRDVSGKDDSYWIDGGLRINALQQIEFLQQLQGRTLPFSPSHMRFVAGIMVRNGGKGWVMRAKSGWIQRGNPQLGWLAGWVEREGRVWLFATDVDILVRHDTAKRMSLSMDALREAGAIPREK